MAARHIGDLHMRIPAMKVAHMPREIAFGDLAMIKIELQRDVLMRDAIEDDEGLARAAEKIAGVVARIERLDQQGRALSRRARAGALQIGDIDRLLRPPLIAQRLPGKDVDVRTAESPRVGQRLIDARIEISLAAELRSKAAVARLEIAHRRVKQHDLDAGGFSARRNFSGRKVVWKLELDRGETGLARRGEAVQERKLPEQGGEIGREFRHSSSFRNGRTGASVYCYGGGNKGMTQTGLAIEPRGDQDHSAAQRTDRRQFRSGLFLSGLAHAAILVLLFFLWQTPADEVIPVPAIPVTVINEQEGQSGAVGNGNGDTAASASDTQSQEAATENPAQTAPATAQEEQPQQAETRPTPTQPTATPTPPTPTPSLPQSKTALEQAPPLPPEPVPPRKPALPKPKPKVVEQPTPPAPSPPAPQTAQASPTPTTSGAVQGTNAPLPAGVGGQGRGDTGRGLAEVGNGAANGTADDYLGLVRRWILRFAKTPKDDCSREHGDGKMDVTFHRDGTVADVHITQSSGCPASDAEAVRMVQAASPLPPIPDRYPGDPKTMGLPFDFRPGFFDRLFHH